MRLHFRHVIPHSPQLHGGAEQIKLVQVFSQYLFKILHNHIFICKGTYNSSFFRIFAAKIMIVYESPTN